MWLRMVRKSEESSNSFWLKGLGELSFVCRKIKRFWNSAIEVSFDLELIENRGFGRELELPSRTEQHLVVVF